MLVNLPPATSISHFKTCLYSPTFTPSSHCRHKMSSTSNKEEQFDALFLSIAQHHPEGASQVKFVTVSIWIRLKVTLVIRYVRRFPQKEDGFFHGRWTRSMGKGKFYWYNLLVTCITQNWIEVMFSLWTLFMKLETISRWSNCWFSSKYQIRQINWTRSIKLAVILRSICIGLKAQFIDSFLIKF